MKEVCDMDSSLRTELVKKDTVIWEAAEVGEAGQKMISKVVWFLSTSPDDMVCSTDAGDKRVH